MRAAAQHKYGLIQMNTTNHCCVLVLIGVMGLASSAKADEGMSNLERAVIIVTQRDDEEAPRYTDQFAYGQDIPWHLTADKKRLYRFTPDRDSTYDGKTVHHEASMEDISVVTTNTCVFDIAQRYFNINTNQLKLELHEIFDFRDYTNMSVGLDSGPSDGARAYVAIDSTAHLLIRTTGNPPKTLPEREGPTHLKLTFIDYFDKKLLDDDDFIKIKHVQKAIDYIQRQCPERPF